MNAPRRSESDVGVVLYTPPCPCCRDRGCALRQAEKYLFRYDLGPLTVFDDDDDPTPFDSRVAR